MAENPDSASARRRWWAAWALLLLAAGLLMFGRGLTRVDEGRYAETAREMLVPGGDFWQMRLMGVRYYEKPPMTYWMVASSMKMLGTAGAAARLPLLLGLAATLALCARWARREWGADAARMGQATLLSCTGVIVGMSVLLTDPLLVGFFSATCLFLFEAYRLGRETRRWPWLLAAAAAAWGGVLTKGFIAVVLPGAILFIWLAWERRLRDLWRWSLIPIGFLFFAALVTTLAHVEQHNPGFNYRFIVEEHIQRFTGTRRDQGHPEAWWFFIPILPVLLCPWAFFAPRAIRGMRANGDLKGDSFSRFLVVWAAVVFLFFSASTGKLMSYVMPMMPPVALLIARRGLLPVQSAADAVDRRLWAVGALVPLLCPIGLAVFWGLARFGALDEDFGAPRWILLLPLAAALGADAWICFRGYWKTASGLLLVVSASYAALGFLTSPLAGPEFLVGLNDNRAFCREVARRVQPTDELVLCKKHVPALAFYAGRVPWLYCVDNELVDGMAMEPDLPGIFRDSAALNAASSAGQFPNRYAVLLKTHQAQLEQEGLRFAPEAVAENRELVLRKLLVP